VKRVVINGRAARVTSANFATREADLDNTQTTADAIFAHAEDEAGNVDRVPHCAACRGFTRS
jgi:hypothetical protein